MICGVRIAENAARECDAMRDEMCRVRVVDRCVETSKEACRVEHHACLSKVRAAEKWGLVKIFY
jgi:hypothetical protein